MTTVEVSTLSRLVGEMKTKGLLSRRRSADNGRTVVINLTVKGRELAEELMPLAQHFEKVAVHHVPAEDVSRLKALLSAVYSNLDAIEPELEAFAPRARGRSSR
jgi:DNA-binding MarR family transcriptional regulator